VGFWQTVRRMLGQGEPQPRGEQQVPSRGYAGNLGYFRQRFGQAPDLLIREFQIGGSGQQVAVIAIDSIADGARISREIILPLSSFMSLSGNAHVAPGTAREYLATGQLSETLDLADAERKLLLGFAVILLQGYRPLLTCDVRANVGRGIETAMVEATVFGPKQSFGELLGANTALIRQMIRSPDLKLERLCLGRITQTPIHVFYLEGAAPPEMVQEIRRTLHSIEVGELIDPGQLAELINPRPLSPFAQELLTERPDRVVGNLLEGRVAILVDGSPLALITPTAFTDLFQASDDYYDRSLASMIFRMLRVLAFFLATFGPALYVMVVTFDYAVIPTDLIIPIAEARSGLPLRPVEEALLMLVVVDILKEGSLRLPSRIAQTVGVIGGFVLGQAVIQANLISPLLIIVIAISIIGSFSLPNYQVVSLVRVLRYPLLLGASLLGGAGLFLVVTALMIHVSSLTIFGVPYLRPVAPLRLDDMGDFIYRQPYRTTSLAKTDRLKGEQPDERQQ
jgi:hypothetical protein